MDLVCPEGLKYHLEYKELIKYTDNFNQKNYVGDFQFGKVYRGKIEHSTHIIQHVLVKIWKDKSKKYLCNQGDNETRLMQEIMLLRHEKLKNHPGRIELYGYCWDNEHLGVVYNLKPLDTLHNLTNKDSFTWVQRIKVAIGFARFLQVLHTGDPTFKPMLVRNIAAAHIILDEEYNPRLFDFSMISGGIFPDRTVYENYYLVGCFGYIDYLDKWGKWTDVFAFGIVLLLLITKRVLEDDSPNFLKFWAWKNYKRSESDSESDSDSDSDSESESENRGENLSSFVDSSLEMDPDFCFVDGRKITKLAMSCIRSESFCPSMKRVVKKLLKLQVVKKHTKFMGLDPKLQDSVDC